MAVFGRRTHLYKTQNTSVNPPSEGLEPSLAELESRCFVQLSYDGLDMSTQAGKNSFREARALAGTSRASQMGSSES